MSNFLSLFLGLIVMFVLNVGCSSKKQTTEMVVEKSSADQVELFMAKAVEISQIEKQFSSYSLKSKGLSSRSQNIAVFSFDNSKVDGNALVTMLMDSELILAAKLMDGKMGGAQSGKSGKKKTVILKQ